MSMTREEFDSVKKGDEVSLEWRDSISGNNSGKFKVKSTSTSKKYGRKKITMVSVKNPNSRPVYLYKEIDGDRKPSLALGNMAASLKSFKKNENDEERYLAENEDGVREYPPAGKGKGWHGERMRH